MKSNKKRGVVDVHLNWIFILLVVGVFAFFFMKIMTSQKTIFQQQTSSMASANLKTIFISKQLMKGTSSVAELPASLDYSCSGFTLEDSAKSFGTGAKATFAPAALTSASMQYVFFSKEFYFPFLVDDVLYVTSKDYLYVFVNSAAEASFIKSINDSIPDSINKEIKDNTAISTMSNQNHKIRFINITSYNALNSYALPAWAQSMKDDEVSAVWIKRIGDDYGNLTFYKKQGALLIKQGNSSQYLDNASLFGAIFSDNKVTYICNLEKMLKKLEIEALIYSNRSNQLKQYYTGIDNTACNSSFETANTLFGNINLMANQAVNILNSDKDITPKIIGLVQNKDEIQTVYTRAMRFSCANIY